jgi:hypothetical protein
MIRDSILDLRDVNGARRPPCSSTRRSIDWAPERAQKVIETTLEQLVELPASQTWYR